MPSPADTDNIIEDNTIVGNANGIFIAPGVAGNTMRRNLVVGNPPLQVTVDHASNGGFDIKNSGSTGANTFDQNVCISGMNAPCPAIAPSGESVLEDELQSLGCGTYPPAASCQLTISQWNYILLNKINSEAQVLVIGDGTQKMTAQQYVQARLDAGL